MLKNLFTVGYQVYGPSNIDTNISLITGQGFDSHSTTSTFNGTSCYSFTEQGEQGLMCFRAPTQPVPLTVQVVNPLSRKIGLAVF